MEVACWRYTRYIIVWLTMIYSCLPPVKADSNWLLHALIEGQRDIERFLCDNGADWSTVMVHAADQGHAEIVCSAIKRGVDVDTKCMSLIGLITPVC